MKKIFCAVLAVILALPAGAASPSLSARSAVLMTAEGDVLYEKSADEQMPMASTTKIMTCLLAAETLDLQQIVTVTDKSAGTEGSSLYLKAGDRVSVEDLIYGAMLRSANDAASALAVYAAGSEEAFADMMNEKAGGLGMESTHFTNPHGLPGDEHYTTARDFALLAAYAMQNETFARIAGTKEYVVTVNGSEKKPVKNHNRLLFSYDGACGVKTGFTKDSGRCLVSCAKRDGVTLVCVTLDAPDDWEDHRTLLDLGFDMCSNKTLCEAGEIEKSYHVFGAGYVRAVNSESIAATVRKGDGTSYVFYGDRFPALPIYKGDPIGKVRAVSGGRTAGEADMVAAEDVPLPQSKKLIDRIKEFFGI